MRQLCIKIQQRKSQNKENKKKNSKRKTKERRKKKISLEKQKKKNRKLKIRIILEILRIRNLRNFVKEGGSGQQFQVKRISG